MKRFIGLIAISLFLWFSGFVAWTLINYQYVEDVSGTIIAKKESFEVNGRHRAKSCYLVGVRPDDGQKYKTFIQKVDMVTFETKNVGDRVIFTRLPKVDVGDESWTEMHEGLFCISIVGCIIGVVGCVAILISFISDLVVWCMDKISNFDFSKFRGRRYTWLEDRNTLIIDD